MQRKKNDAGTGKLKIGDNWNAITIIALSQTNPLKAIAEFVENSIDARAKNIQIIRGKHRGEHFLRIVDDGEGIDDFKYVATHIADSIKKRLKSGGMKGLQGEFGIGLLSFWTVGEELTMTSTGKEGATNRMRLVKNNPGYSIAPVGALFGHPGTELLIKPILPGIRQLGGEKIQNYLASELRDRIGRSGARITIVDRAARKQYTVKPRQFSGRLLHNLPDVRNPIGEIYCEIYISDPKPENSIGLYRQGTRVLPSIVSLDRFNRFPWTSGYLEGIIDASFLQLTPGTRDGIVYDASFDSFCTSLDDVELKLGEIVSEHKNAVDEEASKNILLKVRKALKEAFLVLPKEEYNWLDIHTGDKSGSNTGGTIGGNTGAKDGAGTGGGEALEGVAGPGDDTAGADIQKSFFDYPGPLYRAMISPSSSIVGVGERKKFRIIARDRNKRLLDSTVTTEWKIKEGAGAIDAGEGEAIEFTAPDDPGLTILETITSQDEIRIASEAIITITAQLIPKKAADSGPMTKKGLPGYTFRNAPGELWRSRFDPERYLIIINNGHADFMFASRNSARKLKYIMRLFAKELILGNFPESSKEEILERLIELTLYTEDHLR